MIRKLIPIIGFLIITFVFFWQFFIKGLVLIPADALVGLYHPYRDYFAKDFERGYPYKNFLITDPVLQQYPWRKLAIDIYKDKNIPLWNPYASAGEPLIANIQVAAFYPLNLIFFLLPFIYGWMSILILQIFLGGLFTYLYLRNLKLRKESAFFASSAYMLSGFFFSWISWNTLIHVVIWFPLILLSIDKIFQNSKRRELLIWSSILIFSISASFFAGHLQLFFYGIIFTFLYLIFRFVNLKENAFKKIFIIFGSFLIFLLITSFQWFTTFKLIGLSSRNLDQLHWQTKEGWFIPFKHLVQFIAPDFYGNPVTLNYWGTWNYAELVGYVGIITLSFSLFSIFNKKDYTVKFYFITLIISLFLVLPNFISRLPFILNFPFISSSQPTRLLFIIDFSLIVLSAYGIELFLKREKNIKFLLLINASLLVIISVIWFYIFSNNLNEKLIISQRNLILPSLICLGQFILLVSAYFFRKKEILILLIFYILLIVNIVDLIRYGLKFNPFVSKSLVYPQTKSISFLSESSKLYPWRTMGVDYVENQKRIMPPNIGAYNKIYMIDNYNPLLLKNYQEFIALSELKNKDVFKFSFNRMIIPNNYNSRLIDLLGVKYIVAINDTYSDKLKFLFKEGESRVYENKNAFPRAFMVYDLLYAKTPQESISYLFDKKIDLRKTGIVDKDIKLNSHKKNANLVKIISYKENEVLIYVNTENDGLLILTDNYYPGWIATIDGKKSEIIKTDHTFRGVIVPKGEHNVEFKFNNL